MSTDRSQTIARVCNALMEGDRETASEIVRGEYPFIPLPKTKRRYTEVRSLRLFLRDGFIDRYSGSPLVLPATLRLLSKLLPDEFPAHPNWKMSESHIAFWEVFPTVDHVVPVARGGLDTEENWVTTSMLRNGAKSHWTLEELGWQLYPAGNVRDWDGLTSWFLLYIEHHPVFLEDAYLKRWHKAALLSQPTIDGC